MSDKKQVIHVRDLVIKADNVYVEKSRHDRHHRDRLFESRDEHGKREGRESSNDWHHRESGESSNERDHRESESREHKNRRGPFDWF